MTPPSRRTAALLLCAALSVAAIACGGGSSPVAPGPPPPPPAPRVIFLADGSNPGLDAISLQAGTATAERFTLLLQADGVTDLYGYGIDIVFDPALVAFETATAGSYFDESGVSVTTQVVEGPPGTLVVGQSRVGDVSGVSGTGVMLSIDFLAVAPGTGIVSLENGGAFDATGGAASIDFYGGTVTVPATTGQ